ncbi:MAG: alginate export family protein, partial [Syntrophales bacterium]
NSTATPPGLNKDEIDFDNLYVAAKGLLDSHLDLRIGRQDLVGEFGDNFLVVDGTPGDGSRTFYFNAARATVKFNERYNLDLVYLFNQYNDGVLPSLYQSSPPGKDTLNTSDEIGILAYGRGRITDNLTIEPYYMYKDEKVAGYPVAAPSVDPTAYKLGKEQLKLNTVGARVVIGLGPDWTLKGEYAHQFGEYDDGTGRVGDGGNVFVGRQFKDVVLKPSVNLGYVYLSGDKQDSSKVEGWDPLWSRYPWLFEGQGYTYVPETGIKDYYTNLEAVRASFNFVLTPQTGLMLAYNHLWANQSESNHYYYASATSYYNIFSKDGKNRGDLVQVVLSHNFTDKITGFLQVEDFMPGNYYNDTNRDNALFVRWQLEWKI